MNSRNHHMWSSYSHYLVSGLAGISQNTRSASGVGGGYRSVRFFPASSGLGLSHARAELELPIGRVAHEWRRHGGTQCGKAAEGRPMRLDCGSGGGTITSIDFASFGAPEGICGAFTLSPRSCHAPATTHVLEERCLGRQFCQVTADAVEFLLGDDDEAFRTVKCAGLLDAAGASARLYAQATCSAPPSLHVRVEVPLASAGTVHLRPPQELGAARPPAQLHGGAASFDRREGERGQAWLEQVLLTERESGAVIFNRGKVHKTANASIIATAATDDAGRDIIQVAVGSGTYNLLMTSE